MSRNRTLRWRERLGERDGWHCHYCGIGLTEAVATVDHVVPLARGGTDAWDNLVLACRICNEFKGDRLPEELPEDWPRLAWRAAEERLNRLIDATRQTAVATPTRRRLVLRDEPYETIPEIEERIRSGDGD